MQISSSSAATSSMALNALRDVFQTQPKESTGQNSPTGEASKSAKRPPPPPPPPPPPTSSSGGGFSADIMSALLQTQEASSAASDAIDEADTNGDGTVSLAELAASLGTDEAEVTEAFARIDSDSDGEIDAGELEAGLESASRRRGPNGPPPPARDVAVDMLAMADRDGGGSLSLDEVSSALGQDNPASLSDAFVALDTNGDGGLAADELTTAVEAIFARQMAAYADNTGRASTWSRSVAA